MITVDDYLARYGRNPSAEDVANLDAEERTLLRELESVRREPDVEEYAGNVILLEARLATLREARAQMNA